MLNKLIARSLPFIPKSIVKQVSSKYIAGESIEEASRVVNRLNSMGAMATIDALGEFVINREQALETRNECASILEKISENKLDSNLSIKLTSLGLDIDRDFCLDNLIFLVAKAKQLGNFVRIDMENSPYTDITLEFYKKLRDLGYSNVGVVIQAYLKRSAKDLETIAQYKPSIRLCKGIYVEDSSIAYKDKQEIRDNYKRLLSYAWDNNFYVGIATHDDELIDFAEMEINRRKFSIGDYEFQMLLGVREEKRAKLISKGHRLRVYTPFGKDWYGYSIRRLKENPAMAGNILKATIGIGS